MFAFAAMFRRSSRVPARPSKLRTLFFPAVFSAASLACAATPKFTVMMMPDPQHYTWAVGRDIFDKQSNWIKNNTASRNIKFTVWLGDLTANNKTDEWPVCSAAFQILDDANVPYSFVPGNHDYFLGTWKSMHDRNLSRFNNWLPVSRYSARPWYGGPMEANHNENNVCYFSAGNLDFMVLNMEYAPRKEVLTWANNLISSHPNHRVIIATHGYIGNGGVYNSSMGTEYGAVGSRGVDLWNECASRHSNVFMVVCGHITESHRQAKTGVAGNTVWEMVVDYQQEGPLNNGSGLGNGWMRLLEFDPDNNKINASTLSVVSGDPTIFKNGVDQFYEPMYNSSPTHDHHKFTMNYNMGPIDYVYMNDDTAFHDCFVNDIVGSHQLDPDIAQAANGNWAGVWEDDSDTNGINRIFVRGFDPDANQRFADVVVNSTDANTVDSTNPSIAMAADGRFVVAYQSASNAIKARAYNANGTPVAAETTVISVSGVVRDPDVAMDNNGNFVVVWEDDGDGNGTYQVRARGFAFNQTERFAAKPVNSIAAGQQVNPAIDMAANGDYVVAWDDDQDGDGLYEIGVRGFLANESQRFAQMVGNATTVGQQLDADIAMDDTGRFVVVWEDDSDGNNSWQLRGRGFGATGTQIIPEMDINLDSAGDQLNPSVDMDSLGNWYVAWEDSGAGGEGWQIMSQEFSIAGARLFADDVQVNTVSAVDHDSGAPRRKDAVISAHKSGRYICAWADNMDGDESFDILAKGVTGNARSLVVKSLNGTVSRSPVEPFYKKNSSVTLTATPNANYVFSKWQGDVPAGSEFTNPLTLNMDANKNLTAVYQGNAVPAAPTGLNASAAGENQVNLTWTDTSSNETSFVVGRSDAFDGPYTDIATLAANTTSYSNTGLTSGTTYYYVVRSVNASGSSSNSNEAGVTTAASGSYIVDNPSATVTGTWNTGTSAADKYGADYRFKNQGSGESVAFAPNLATAGSYDVYEWHPHGTNRTEAAPYVVNYNGGTDVVWLDQQDEGGAWNPVGTFNFAAGTAGNVTVTDQIFEPAPQVVMADAIRFVYAGPPAPPSIPQELVATLASPTQIDLQWQNSLNESGYVVARSTVSHGTYTPIATLGANVTSYSDTGLADGVTYYYVVRATNSAGTSGDSSEAFETTPLNPPNAPSGLSATAASQTQINLAWTDNSNTETTVVVCRSTTAGGPYTDVATLGPNTVAYSSTGLTANTTYYYVVRAENDAGVSANSGEASATTLPNVPAAPSGLAAAAISPSQINLTWTDNASNETNMVVARATAAGGPFTDIATLGANATSYSNTGLAASTTYYYVVRATNSGGASANSNTANATTQSNAPSAPSGLGATVISKSQINLAWTDTSSNETNFVVARGSAAAGPFTDIATLGANVTSYSNTGLTANTAYYYVVRATNAGGASANSNVASGTTLPNSPSAPTGLTATAMSPTKIDLTWTDASTNETNFIVARGTSASGPFTDIATLAANTTAYSNTGLTGNTRYYYVVRATNAGGASANSAAANALTWPADIIVDNSDAGFTASANWNTGTSAADKYGSNYRFHDTASVSDLAQWSISVPQTRTYEIYAWWSQGSNRATGAPYTLTDNSVVTANQTTNGGTWVLLGTKSITAGTRTVKLSCWTSTGAVVIADAIRLKAK